LKQRNQLINPDFIYDFASNRNPAHFYDLERVKKMKGRKESPVKLLRTAEIVSAHSSYCWSKKQLKDYGDRAVIKIDLERGGDLKDIYREDIISRIHQSEPVFLELREKQAKQKSEYEAACQKQAQEAREKAKKSRAFQSEYEPLIKKARGYFNLLPWTNAISGDIRMAPINKKVGQVCEDLLPPLTQKGKYPYKFKSLEAMELFIEEVLVVMNPPIEEGV
jgi:hypothetical protein